jgi:glucose-1-phosphatase
MSTIKNIIFDLGGVIMNIDFKQTEKAFSNLGFNNFSEYITQFHITALFEEYETGKINDAAFIQGIQQLSPRPLTENEIVHAWNALLLDFPPERIELLKKIKQRYRIFLLSNTNALHHAEFQKRFKVLTGGYLEDIFHKTYYSQTTGMRKPNAEIYQLVIDENKLNPSETLFIDDTASNFSGAQQAGLQTFHLKAPMTILELPLFQNED